MHEGWLESMSACAVRNEIEVRSLAILNVSKVNNFFVVLSRRRLVLKQLDGVTLVFLLHVEYTEGNHLYCSSLILPE